MHASRLPLTRAARSWRGIRARGEPAAWAAAVRLPCRTFLKIPNQRKQNTAISTNQGSARAWRAPNHPQAAVITMGAVEDLAAKLKMDPLELILANMEIAGPRAQTYREEFAIADELMGWKKNWHQRGDKTAGRIKRGMGLSMHTWGGRGHNSNCDFTINPDGSVEIKMGTQDLGTGARTIITIVAADTLGIPDGERQAARMATTAIRSQAAAAAARRRAG